MPPMANQREGSRTGVRAAVVRASRRPFSSLPSRIITSVFAAAVVTSFGVAYTATRSTEVFLRQKIDDRFPQTLSHVSERLDGWYSQRDVDIATFARSDTVAESVAPGGRFDLEARAEARKYLSYVREGFSQYSALFVLDEKGDVRVWVGERSEISKPLLERLAQSRETTGMFYWAGKERIQFISSPIVIGGTAVGSLHAVVGADAVEALLQSDDLESDTRVFLVGEGNEIVAHSQGLEGRFHRRPIPATSLTRTEVEDYYNDQGGHVVGSAMPFRRFGWGLVVEESYDAAFAPIVSVRRRITAINLLIVVGFSLLAFLIARSIVQPIRALSESASRIAQGETDVEIPVATTHDEIGILSRALGEMVSKLRNANEELRRTNEVLEQLSFTDGLTHLHNHRYFQDRLRIEAKRANRSDESLALLLIDIDDFKALNDRYGHAVGDQVLRSVASTLNSSVRETDLPARYGGEEFAVLAPRTSADGATSLAEKLRLAIANSPLEAEGLDEEAADLRVTASVGVAVYMGDEKRLFNEADRALYRAKANGKNCSVSALDA